MSIAQKLILDFFVTKSINEEKIIHGSRSDNLFEEINLFCQTISLRLMEVW